MTSDPETDVERKARLFEVLAANMDSLVALLNDSGEFSYVSPSVERISGYTPEEIYELKTFATLVLPEDAAEITRVRRAFKQGKLDGEIKRRAQIIRKDGRRDWTEIHVSLVPSLDNPGKQDMLIKARQISALVSAEEELQDSKEELQRNSRLFELLAQNATDAIALRPQFGNYYYMSPEWERRTGYTIEQLTEKGHPKFKLLHPDDLPMGAARDKEMGEYGTSREYEPLTIRYYNREGQIRWGEMATILVPSIDDPEALDVLISIHDITERMRVHQELEAAKQELEANLETIQRDIGFAASVQKAILPPSFPDDPRIDMDGFMEAARAVGGDFYDYYILDKDTIGLVIADVANKGVSAALFMAVSSTVMESAARTEPSPSAALAEVNRRLNAQNPLNMFVSLFYAMLDLRTGLMTYCNAGHNPPFVVNNLGETKALPLTDDTFLGMMEDLTFKEHEVRLDKGETLFMYTDGVVDAENAKNELFGEPRLRRALQASHGSPIPEILNEVRENVSIFVDDAEQSDDLTALCIRYIGT